MHRANLASSPMSTPVRSAPSASEFFTKTMMGYRATKALLVSNRIGVFDALDAVWLDGGSLAQKIGCDVRATTVLVRALAAMGVLEERDGRFTNAPLASEYLVRGKPRYTGNNLRFQDILWEGWSNLEPVVRSGKPWRDLGELLGREDQTFTAEYIRGMHNIAAEPAHEVARMLGARPLASMLDVGAGPGTYALALLDAHPNLRATLLDLPETLVVTRELVRDHVHASRLELKEGDYVASEFGEGYDLVLMSHVTHDEGPDRIAKMLSKAFAALAPGGRVAIHDWVVDETKCSPLYAALFSLNLIVYTAGGRIYSVDEYRAMLESAGFASITAEMVLESKAANPTCLILGMK
jgi:3-hydroxy-5-methyl-1-naphthoate 3-O-methyltransferase